MPNVIKIKNSSVTGNTPSGLVNGELAINLKDKKLFFLNDIGILQSFELIAPVNTHVFTTIDFGTNPINEKSFNVVDVNCTETSKIDISQYFITQSEENFGVMIDLFTECFNGNFNIIAVSREQEEIGIFNIKYKIL